MPKRIHSLSAEASSSAAPRSHVVPDASSQPSAEETPLSPLVTTDLLSMVMGFCDAPALAKCLRVSKLFFEIAGPILYRHLTFDHRTPHPFVALDPPRGRGKRPTQGLSTQSAYSKHTLVRHTRTIDIRAHSDLCQFLSPSSWAAHLSQLHTVRVFVEPSETFELCSDDPCGLLEGLTFRTLVIHGLSSPCAETPFGLDRPIFSKQLEKVVFRFVPFEEVYRASEDFRIYNLIPPSVKQVVLHYPTPAGAAMFSSGAGRLFVDDFEPEEEDDEFGRTITLGNMADLFAELVTSQTERGYTVVDAGSFDAGWAGIPGGGEGEVAEAVETAIRTAVEGKLERRKVPRDVVEGATARLDFMLLREYLYGGAQGEFTEAELGSLLS